MRPLYQPADAASAERDQPPVLNVEDAIEVTRHVTGKHTE
jgi:hypothetical protein